MALPNWQRTITDSEGNVVPSAQITVLVEATGLAANLFEDREGNTPLSNSFNTGSDGFAEFYVEPGVYRVIAELPIGTRTWRYESILDAATDNTWTGDQSFTGDNTHSGIETFTGDVDIAGRPFVQSVAPKWQSGETYDTIGERVLRYGVQFVNIHDGNNTGNDPLTSPDSWLPSPDPVEILRDHATGRVRRGESIPIHDYEDPRYELFIPLGRWRFGGSEDMDAYAVHLDSSTATGSLADILDSWHLADLWAPGDPRVLVDARETVDRSVGSSGGEAETIGERQNDQGQQIEGYITYHHDIGIVNRLTAEEEGALQPRLTDDLLTTVSESATTGAGIEFNSADSTVAGGSKQDGTEFRGKSVVTGVPYIIVMQPVAS